MITQGVPPSPAARASEARSGGPRGRWLAVGLAFVPTVVSPGCASWPDRPVVPAQAQAVAQVPGFPNIRHWADAPLSEWDSWRERLLRDRAAAGALAPPTVLAISSGSDKGAFAAGYLTGWSTRGDRPAFTLVTGVSTGALIAPFAFLGPSEDEALRILYTGITRGDVYHPAPVHGVLGGPALAESKPLARLIDRYVTSTLLDRIAAQHRRGRRLLVLTANLDAGRGVVWDMGEIAASTSNQRLALFQRILLASSSIPGVFPPVLLDVVGGGYHFREMHADGGTISSVFALPSAVLWSQTAGPAAVRGGSITLLYNGSLSLKYKVIRPRTFPILARALETLINEADQQAVLAHRRFAEANDASLTIAGIGPDFQITAPKLFDRRYMGALYRYGVERGRSRMVAVHSRRSMPALNEDAHDGERRPSRAPEVSGTREGPARSGRNFAGSEARPRRGFHGLLIN